MIAQPRDIDLEFQLEVEEYIMEKRTALSKLCPFCYRPSHSKACPPLRVLLFDPPFDEGPPTVLDEAPVEITNEEY